MPSKIGDDWLGYWVLLCLLCLSLICIVSALVPIVVVSTIAKFHSRMAGCFNHWVLSWAEDVSIIAWSSWTCPFRFTTEPHWRLLPIRSVRRNHMQIASSGSRDDTVGMNKKGCFGNKYSGLLGSNHGNSLCGWQLIWNHSMEQILVFA